MDVYFPARCISEEDLEKFDGVSAGKVSRLAGRSHEIDAESGAALSSSTLSD